MKKNKFWLAAMAVTVSMASCSLEEVMEQPEPQAIGFSSFVGKPTRAVTEIVNPGSAGGGTPLSTFYVFGKYGDAAGGTYTNDVFSNTSVTVTATNTEIATAQYWVPNKYYKFAAYSDGNNSLTTTDKVSFDENGHITITDYEAGDKDLILATPDEVQTDATISAQPNAVPLTFNHLLSQVSFQFVGEGFPAGYQIKIEGLTFSVNNTATYTSSNNSWGELKTSASKGYTVASGAAFAFDTKTTSDANFVIPQSYSSDITATFTATIYDNHGSTVASKAFTTASLLASSASGIPTKWDKGYRYQYNIKITPSEMTNMFPIKFTVTAVSGWQNSTTPGDSNNLDLN
ncbi:fimbrillin family protein [Phocaeicola coprophilus]|uniref:fimbrillin family protein n=1 Tax=Phocaeicola coprophilus TaxID=387090 RepID=UPI0040260457